MALFSFNKSGLLGNIVSVDTRKVLINVESSRLRSARVSRLVAIKIPGAVEEWLISIIEKVMKISIDEDAIEDDNLNSTVVETDDDKNKVSVVPEKNSVIVSLVGTVKAKEGVKTNVFSRSILGLPDIDASCYTLEGKNLEKFMGIISSSSKGEHALDLGYYTLDSKAKAYLDGNKFFQRHASILGSTGSGKSWTVATILEKAAKLPSSNLIVFDLHGEYRKLGYAKQLRIAGLDDLDKKDEDILFLPYWLLNSEEIQAMFIDRSEFSAHNQVMAFQDIVTEKKKATLLRENKKEVLNSFTIDSPVPFSLAEVVSELKNLNEEMVQGVRSLKQGKFFGQFSRLLVRITSRINDKRYGFLFKGSDIWHQYDALYRIAKMLMGFSDKNNIKVIDFSEVPADVRPIIVGLVARIVYQIQFWTDGDKRQPLAFVCDEAHLYLPKKSNINPNEKRALENFEKIAKEGRKYGVALLVVSQRPSDVSDTILSQCNNVIALRLTNSADQTVVKKLMPESLESFMDILPILDTGEALIVGDSVLLPTRVKISEPAEKPLSATIDFWKEWNKNNITQDLLKAVENMRRQSRR